MHQTFQKLLGKIYEEHEEVFLGDVVRLLREIITDVDGDMKVRRIILFRGVNLVANQVYSMKVSLLLEQYLINGERTIAPTEFLVIIIL